MYSRRVHVFLMLAAMSIAVQPGCGDIETCISGDCELVWIQIPGGTFMMGSDTGIEREQPVHEVTVPDFEMTKTEVTVAQYLACVDAGGCTVKKTRSYCYWDDSGSENFPMNCVDWNQAVDFCEWAGCRLPSEAEWEYAARSGGQNISYPWGDNIATCDYAVMKDDIVGCGTGQAMEVCSKEAGNTEHGLCDMTGNVWEVVQDWYHDSYYGAPNDGSAWEDPVGTTRVVRGGSYFTGPQDVLRVSFRIEMVPSVWVYDGGLRCARSTK